jgi:hypothetical protein
MLDNAEGNNKIDLKLIEHDFMYWTGLHYGVVSVGLLCLW